jgi:hypothetical protein
MCFLVFLFSLWTGALTSSGSLDLRDKDCGKTKKWKGQSQLAQIIIGMTRMKNALPSAPAKWRVQQ